MDAQREVIDASLLATKIEDPDLGIGNSATESGLRVGFVLAVTIATRWTAPHLSDEKGEQNCRVNAFDPVEQRMDCSDPQPMGPNVIKVSGISSVRTV